MRLIEMREPSETSKTTGRNSYIELALITNAPTPFAELVSRVHAGENDHVRWICVCVGLFVRIVPDPIADCRQYSTDKTLLCGYTYHASDCGRACDGGPTASRADTVRRSVRPERPTAR